MLQVFSEKLTLRQFSPMDGGAWWAAVHGVARSRTRLIQLSDFTFAFHFHALEEEVATHSSVLAWRIPGTGEPGGLLSMGSHRVGHDRRDLATAAATPWKESYDQPRQHIKKQRRYFVNKGPSSQGFDFSNGHVWM